MPRIPTYQPNQVGPVQTTDARFRAYDNGGGAMGGVARGLQDLGQAGAQYAETQGKIEAQNDDTQSRLITTQFAGKVTPVKQSFLSLEGGNAREAQAETLKQVAALRDEALGQATNPRMRRLLEERLGPLYQSTTADIGGHALAQQHVEQVGAASGEQAMYADQAAGEQDPTKRQGFIEQASAATNHLLDLKGVTDPTARAYALRKTTSGIHLDVMDRALSSADPDLTYVQTYLAAHKDEMTSDDVGKVEKALQQPLQARQADNDFVRATGGAIPSPASAPSGSPANLVGITGQSESGNRDYTEGGTPVTSPKGALYRMQVMPSTARDPGHGIKPAADNSPAEYNRVGEQLLNVLMRKYGDPAKAWAAYNWGEGRVDRAVADHGAGWLSAAPAETRAYVAKNVAQIDGQGHAVNTPQEWDKDKVYRQIDTLAAKEGWDFERTDRAKRRADQVIGRDEELQARKERSADEQAISIVTQIGGGFTSINQLPRAVRESLSPEALARYTKIAEVNSKPKAPEANGPEVVALHRMAAGDSQDREKFAGVDLRKYQAFMTPAEYDELGKAQASAQAELKNPKEADSSSKIDAAITRAKNWEGVDVSKFTPGEAFRIRRYMQLRAGEETAGGKRLGDADYARFFRDAVRSQQGGGWFGGDARGSSFLSGNMRAVITRALQRNGVAPTEAKIRQYWERMGSPTE